MQSWRYHLYYWGGSILSVLAYHVSAWADDFDMAVVRVFFGGLCCVTFMLLFVLQLHGPLRKEHHQIMAATYILGLVALPHYYIVMISKVVLGFLPVCMVYRPAVSSAYYRDYTKGRYATIVATLMISLGALPHPFVAPVADPWLINGAIHALFSFMTVGALESFRQDVSRSIAHCLEILVLLITDFSDEISSHAIISDSLLALVST